MVQNHQTNVEFCHFNQRSFWVLSEPSIPFCRLPCRVTGSDYPPLDQPGVNPWFLTKQGHQNSFEPGDHPSGNGLEDLLQTHGLFNNL